MNVFSIVLQIVTTSFMMFWEVLWPLVLGFMLSAIVQALVSRQSLAKTLGGASPKNIGFATLLGAASSSCSYAAVAIARSLFDKGASFTSAIVFEVASTNLVFELGIILVVLLGWQFAAAEFAGGILMVIILALIFRFTLTKKLLKSARLQAEKGLAGKMEGHADMHMTIGREGNFFSRLISHDSLTAISHYFVMDWVSVWSDIVLGFLIAGALVVLVPHTFWQSFFFSGNPELAKIEGPLLGPLVAMVSFVCSVGNVPLAAVLWGGGISFGGVVSFIFADLIILPIINIYRKYYGWKMAIYLTAVMYIAIVAACFLVEYIFAFLNIMPTNRNIIIFSGVAGGAVTTILNILFLIVAIVFVIRFFITGGPQMLKMMDNKKNATNLHGMHHH